MDIIIQKKTEDKSINSIVISLFHENLLQNKNILYCIFHTLKLSVFLEDLQYKHFIKPEMFPKCVASNWSKFIYTLKR